MPVHTPKKIGKYDVIDIVGRGGMGIVYRAKDPFLDRLVAIKMMTINSAEYPDLLQRFYREAKSTANLKHPNIVTVYELGEHEGSPYMAMEFLEGSSLDSMIRGKQPLSSLQKVDIIIQVCHGLSYAHQRGIVHRDIKPGNIVVLKDSSVKIVDFGIARIGDTGFTRTGQFMGSLNYMSMEQLNDKLQVDQRTDVYSTGVVLYQLVTGALPFEAESTGATLMKIINDPPPPFSKFTTSFPAELETITLRALVKDRDQRYASADEFAIELTQLQARLKQESIGAHMQQAERLLQQHELFKAHDELLEVLKIDRQHNRAISLLRTVRKQVEKEQNVERAQQLRQQAEEAFGREEFDSALNFIEQAIVHNPTNVEMQQLRGSMQSAKAEADHLRQVLQKAENAHRAGNLDTAKQAIEEVLVRWPNDTRVKSLYRMIQKDLEERLRQKRMESLLDSARKEIANRQYTAAFNLLKEAEKVDPDDPQLRALLEKFTAARDQEQRRRDLEQVTRQIEQALNTDDHQTALKLVTEALRRFPNDPALTKLRDLAETQKEVAQTKSFIREKVATAREILNAGNAAAALKVLEEALRKTPGNPHLESLASMARERLAQDRAEQAKANSIQQANSALERKDYADAMRILEAAQLQYAAAPEIDSLLRFAREQQSKSLRQQEVESSVRRAQEFLRVQEYDRAISLLESLLARVPDDELQVLLEEARRRRDDLDRQIDAAVARGQQFLAEDSPFKAVEFLRSQPTSFNRSERFRDLISAALAQQNAARQAPPMPPIDQEPEAPPPVATVMWDRSGGTVPPVERPAAATRQVQSTTAVRGTLPAQAASTAPRTKFALPRTPILVGAAAVGLIAIVIAVRTFTRSTPSTAVAVQIATIPQGASVRINGTNQSCVTPQCTLKLSPGNYDVEAQLQGYETSTRSIVVTPAGPNSVSISLNEPPSAPIEVPSSAKNEPANPATQQPARLEINGANAGSEVFIDGKAAGRVGKSGAFSTDVLPGDHRIKLLAGNQESAIMTQHFSAGNAVIMRGNQFIPSAPPQPAEQTDWQRVKDSQNFDDIDQFLRRYPNGAFHIQAENRLEDLYWSKDRAIGSSASLRDYLRRYPSGKYAQSASNELARLDWESISNTKDMGTLENYLRVYPSGEYHDRAFGRLDDLLWDKTGRGDDANSLRSYLQTFPSGKHADQGRKQLDLLTRPKETARAPEAPRQPEPTRTTPAITPLPTVDDKTAILGVLAAYERSYENEDLPSLQTIWPSMTPQQIQGVGDFFKNASSVKLTYIVSDNPKISGNDATIEFKQAISYVMNGKFQKPISSKVNMKLRKTGSQGAWLIDSIH